MLLAFALCAVPFAAAAQDSALGQDVASQVRELAIDAAQRAGSGHARVAVDIGELNPRLHLAACEHIEPYLPSGARLWGRTRVGLRCTRGPSPWNVYLPVTVRVFGQALIARNPLPVGAVIAADDLTQAEVDLAEDRSMAVTQMDEAVGRTVARALNRGQSVRESNLKTRQWFAAGDTVKIVAVGAGFSVAGLGQALTPGLEGRPARIRTDGGRVLTGMPAGDHRVEMTL